MMSESPSSKKPRLGDSKPDMPIDADDGARSGPAYNNNNNPQEEATSPTLSESIRDESPRSTTDLLSNIDRVDGEIAKTERQIVKLFELEEVATQPQKEEASPAADSVMQILAQSIYDENRKKAAEGHPNLLKMKMPSPLLGPHNNLPLYKQPSDTTVYGENLAKYKEFKCRLLLHFKSKQKEKKKLDAYLTKTTAQLSIKWKRNVERRENSLKKKAQETKKRELFEKVFPELRKQPEDKERLSKDEKMRSNAVIPPALLDVKTRRRRFKDTNGLIEDPMQEYKDKQVLTVWNDQEKEIFKEKYLEHPKKFGIIKASLDRKCIAECVRYYYLSKKTENYRQLRAAKK